MTGSRDEEVRPSRRPRARGARALRWGLGLVLLAVLSVAVVETLSVFRMPGRSHAGPLPPLTPGQADLRDALRRDVERVAGEIGERHLGRLSGLRRAEAWLRSEVEAAGLPLDEQGYEVDGHRVANLAAEVRGTVVPEEILVVGAHYDTVPGCPGANDNGTGVAATLALLRSFAGASPARTLRFAFFVNEEPPWFQTPRMGSVRYAGRCRERGERVVGMLSLETLGCYSDEDGSQRHPFPLGLFFPSRGDFVAFVGNRASRDLVRSVVGAFRRRAAFPSEGAAVPGFVAAAGWSDHWSFWQAGFPAVMVTDTAPFRYAAYHTSADTPDQVDVERLARVVDGLRLVLQELAGGDAAR